MKRQNKQEKKNILCKGSHCHEKTWENLKNVNKIINNNTNNKIIKINKTFL